MYDPSQQQPPYQPPQPRRRRHVWRYIILGTLAVMALVIGIAVAAAPKPAGPPQTSLQGGTSSPPAAAPAAAPTTPPPSSPTTVTFAVTGTGYPSVDYGSSGNHLSPPQCTGGDLGESCTLPWTATLPFDGTQEFWDIDAQLDSGGGSITCTITVSGPGDQPLTVATGQASGAYQICDAQAAPTDSTGLSWNQE